MRLVTAEVMREADQLASDRLGASELMQLAGLAIASAVRNNVPTGGRIIAFAGPGNNGGDAFSACAQLMSDYACAIYAMPAEKRSDARLDAESHAENAGVPVHDWPKDRDEADDVLHGAALVIDAIFGIGGRADLSEIAYVIEAINDVERPVIAIDVPTGIDATTGEPSKHGAVRATATISLGTVKLGLMLEPARDYVGDIYNSDLGFKAKEYTIAERLVAEARPFIRFKAVMPYEFELLLPKRNSSSDKRSAGAPLIIAGSAQFPGAAVLCARGAARSGAGYVTIATPEAAAAAVRTHLIEQVVTTYDPQDIEKAIDTIVDLTNHCMSIAIGPGLGLDEATGQIVRGVIERTKLPLVLDASAFAHIVKYLPMLRDRECVLTPHANEFARLSGGGTIAPGTRPQRLREFVERTGITTLLKGTSTLIDDGTTMYVNATGTPALATAGTGDVLTGVIATLLSQGKKPLDAARFAAFWHGVAGQRASQQRAVGVIAGDIPESLAAALQGIEYAQGVIREL